ncbi:RNA-binding protein [Candidatus Altiarchaeales archaeon WOR_SM1_SCG]|nr:RNA-binding protein [Candidatus Altiarchaeales archaeon WOR_SM1_SCG]
MNEKLCSSCGVQVMSRYTEFPCPECGETTILRCRSCRMLGTPYACEKCGFTGP